MLEKIGKVLPVSSAYLLGSFTTLKKRPADVDFIIMLKLKTGMKADYSIDLVICPDNKHGAAVVEDAKKWMLQKYGSKKSAFLKLK